MKARFPARFRKRHYRAVIDTTKPPGTCEITRQIFELQMQVGIPFDQIARKSGVAKTTILRWQRQSSPTLPNAVAVLAVLGRELQVKAPMPKRHRTLDD